MGRPRKIDYNRLTRICPECKNVVIHKSGKSRYNSELVNAMCYSCKNKGIRNPFFGKHHSEEFLTKQRERRAIGISNRFHGAFFNKTACDFFDDLNMFMGWNGYHALNGGEYAIVGYFLDYYEPTENLVIEWDEPHHRKLYHKKLDERRATNIINVLQCEFWRIDSITLEFTRIYE